MPKAKQLSIRVENRPGTLAHVARVLGNAKVNILAFLASTSGAAMHIVLDNVNSQKGFRRCGVLLHRGRSAARRTPQHAWSTGELCREAGREGHQHQLGVSDNGEGFEKGECHVCGL